uniref:Uncharacterized protein n=1 Tax=uncultured marine virus TaxID=186617 RepID=A0A0F7L4G2_9VIRU|nr:hypothetical protein [uncultured marine virus]
MIYNVNCQKKSQMLKPEQLFPLPVDDLRKKKKSEPKSTRKEMDEFMQKYQSMNKKTTLK